MFRILPLDEEPVAQPSRRLRRLNISREMVMSLFGLDGHIFTAEGFPPDAKPVNMAYDAQSNSLAIIFEHESFDDVELGDVVPLAVGVRFRWMSADYIKQNDAIAKAARSLDSCVAEFGNDPSCCSEAFQALHEAIHASP